MPLEILKQHLFSFLITKNVKQLIPVLMLFSAIDSSECSGTILTGIKTIKYVIHVALDKTEMKSIGIFVGSAL